ncbi:FAD-dependent oxidoreductase [Telmatospirillum sp. J64-1]|uniref:FAD-dependent oxidoreductase n=1 Tax=Telmatospirillum sp. J64-1 TaxID=2502183 RepID=UPI00163D9D2A|nr:GMC family oxidoreductase [Telmatospirillum sp. J64-1]
MISDLRTRDSDQPILADICIIGGGAAGITIAHELIGSGLSVCLLESGGVDYDPPTQTLYEGITTGQPYFPLDATRLRYFGGSTNHWSGWCTPLMDIDFKPRPWLKDSGWPFSAEHLHPFYERAQHLCRLASYAYDRAPWPEDPPLPAFDPALIQRRFWQVSQVEPWDMPVSFSTAYRPALELADNVEVILHANVTSIEATENAQAVDHLRVSTLEGKTARVQAQYYILACGGIENARLLLLSDSVETAGLGNRHDLVGRYFQEHPHIPVGEVFVGSLLHDRLQGLQPHEHEEVVFLAGLFPAEDFQRRARILNTSIMLGDILPIQAEHPIPLPGRLLRYGPGPLSLTHSAPLFARSEQLPDPESRILLSHDRDSLGLRRPHLHWKLNDIDCETISVFTKLVGAEIARLGLGRVRVADWLREERPSFPPDLYGGNHHMGTTRMSEDPRKGVVDADCRVHSVHNLFIAGSSVFPTSGAGNPTFTIVALALRLADHMKDLFTLDHAYYSR